MLNDHLHVGVVQTSLESDAAWFDDGSSNWQNAVRMSLLEELRAKREIRHFLASLKGRSPSPDIILFPELAVPMGFEKQLKRAAEKLEAIIIAGLDYRIETAASKPTVSNEALVIVPRRLNGVPISRQTQVRRVGKTHPAPAEKDKLLKIADASVAFRPHPTVWIFESDQLGKFGVAICYDFMDLDRIVMYRNKVQTLFILAYNRDTTSFDHMAEALSRTLFCNVVVCNCGQFGGSLAVSPFREPFRRLIYRQSGHKLTHAQIVKLPLAALLDHQQNGNITDFKSRPPGFDNFVSLKSNTAKI